MHVLWRGTPHALRYSGCRAMKHRIYYPSFAVRTDHTREIKRAKRCGRAVQKIETSETEDEREKQRVKQ